MKGITSTVTRATLTVRHPGLSTLVVDAGRPRSRSRGVPLGGAADSFALGVGNTLVGNPVDTAALEICLSGPVLVTDAPLACVLHGAPFALATNRRCLRAGTTFTLEPGEELRIGGTPVGLRAYLCIHGGLDAPVVLGSRTSLEPLRTGDQFGCCPATIATRSIDGECDSASPPILRVLPGGQADWFPPDALQQGSWRVSPSSNRMGLRLEGQALPVPLRDMVSEPVCPGTVQVTRDGQCILLGVDGQTIGGYPRLAQVIAADLDPMGQLRPGQTVTFATVSLEEAAAAWREREARLRGWLTRLRLATTVIRRNEDG